MRPRRRSQVFQGPPASALSLLLLLTCSILPAGALEPPRTRRELDRSEVIIDDPANPGGMQLRRARAPGEPWLVWFQDVLLWPYTARHYNTFYATLDLNGRRLQFIPNVVFEVEGEWILVVRGAPNEVEAAAKRVRLDGLERRFSLRPSRSLVLDDREDGAWLGFIFYTPPSPLPPPISHASSDGDGAPGENASMHSVPLRVMSSFEDFQDAGGVAEILDEEAVRLRYKVLRDPVDVILQRIAPRTP